MIPVTVKTLRAGLASWLDRVAAGERVLVVRRGKAVAVLGKAGVEDVEAFERGRPK